MKLVLGLVCLAVAVAVGTCRFCKTEDDCGEGECCVADNTLDLPRMGMCQTLRKAGRRCNKEEAKLDYYGGKFVNYCPCEAGLVCVDLESVNPSITLIPQGTCRKPVTLIPDLTTDDEVTNDKEAHGPGGEPPRDDDCADWELPC